jgi:hypothetical protein
LVTLVDQAGNGVAVAVLVSDGVRVAVLLRVAVRVLVRVLVADCLGLRVAVRVLVRVRVGVLDGVSVAVGDAVSSALALAAAAPTLMRGIDNGSPFRLSTIVLPVVRNHPNTWVTEAPGTIPLSTAHAPATCGVAIDVPG